MSHIRVTLISAAIAAAVVIAFGRVAFLKSLATPTS
jgi:hypothetical protein